MPGLFLRKAQCFQAEISVTLGVFAALFRAQIAGQGGEKTSEGGGMLPERPFPG
jgi:hypothetical protein